MPETPTPDNTPIPGGGRWKWGDEKPGWVSNEPETPPAADATETTADPQPAAQE